MATTFTFTGGAKLQAYLDRLGRKLGSGASVNVGFLERATYPTGTSAELRQKYAKHKQAGKAGAIKGTAGGQSVAMVAAANEFGDPAHGRVPRPFFRRMIAKDSPEWGDNVAKLLALHDYESERVMRLMGEKIAGELRQSIQEFTSPGLKESTIKAKGFSKPLIDTSHMINSIDYEVN